MKYFIYMAKKRKKNSPQ